MPEESENDSYLGEQDEVLKIPYGPKFRLTGTRV